jgi:hypothetical protein
MIFIAVEKFNGLNGWRGFKRGQNPRPLPKKLLHQVGHKRQNSQVAGTLDGGCDAALVFEAVAGDTARQQFTLFVDELKQEVGILVINVFDAEFAETAVFFASLAQFGVAEEFYIFSCSSHFIGC